MTPRQRDPGCSECPCRAWQLDCGPAVAMISDREDKDRLQFRHLTRSHDERAASSYVPDVLRASRLTRAPIRERQTDRAHCAAASGANSAVTCLASRNFRVILYYLQQRRQQATIISTHRSALVSREPADSDKMGLESCMLLYVVPTATPSGRNADRRIRLDNSEYMR